MANLVKAELAEKVKRGNIIKIALVATVSVIGLMLAAVSVINGSFIFAIAYFVAGILGVLYTIIKINATFPPSLQCDGEKLTISTWDNGFFPYKIDFKPAFFADFVPAKTVTNEIMVSQICDIAIGTRGYLSKTLKSYELDKRLREISSLSRRLDTVLKRCDIFYLRLKDDRIYTMSVSGFDIESLHALVDMIEHKTAGIEFKTNLRLLRRKRETIDGRQRI